MILQITSIINVKSCYVLFDSLLRKLGIWLFQFYSALKLFYGDQLKKLKHLEMPVNKSEHFVETLKNSLTLRYHFFANIHISNFTQNAVLIDNYNFSFHLIKNQIEIHFIYSAKLLRCNLNNYDFLIESFVMPSVLYFCNISFFFNLL